jgi:hypothetical protein
MCFLLATKNTYEVKFDWVIVLSWRQAEREKGAESINEEVRT